jgi:hypothetical protein
LAIGGGIGDGFGAAGDRTGGAVGGRSPPGIGNGARLGDGKLLKGFCRGGGTTPGGVEARGLTVGTPPSGMGKVLVGIGVGVDVLTATGGGGAVKLALGLGVGGLGLPQPAKAANISTPVAVLIDLFIFFSISTLLSVLYHTK